MKSVRIAGAGTVASGEYDEVSASGAVSVVGDIKCNVFKSSGATSSTGTIKANTFHCSGSMKASGDILAEKIRVSGAIRIEGKLEGSTANISGSVVIEDDVNVDKLECKISNGSFENIYGDEVRINSDGNFFSNYFHEIVKNIKAKEIEATTISIKDVTADRVSGEVVCIEAGCKVKIVEYSKSLDISSQAKIEQIIKL